MDFGTLLHVAKKNNESGKNAEGKYYSTKFSAPKKESKEKALSDNIKKFLAKKEKEERERTRIEKEKRDQLLAMRDEKSKNKIKKMLKVIKSANKSVLEDAVDTENTAVTLQGPDQPDEDDYGYVSHEAAAFYKKYMDKVKTLPEDNKFAPSRPLSKNDISGTKDRVRAAIQKEQEERINPNRSKSSKPPQSSTSTSTSTTNPSTTLVVNSHRKKDLYDPTTEKELEEKKRREEEKKKTKVKKPAPPMLDFKELLKLAEKKQHEPLEVVVETKKEPERLLTKKEKKELEERQRYFEEKERRRKEGQQNLNKTQSNGKIPKLDVKESLPALPKKISNDKPVSSSLTSMQKISASGSSTSSSKETFKKPPSTDQITPQKLSSSSKPKVISADHKNNNLPVNNSKLKSEVITKSISGPSKSAQPSGTLNRTKPTVSKANDIKLPSVAKPTSALSSSKISKNESTRQLQAKDTQAARKLSLNHKDVRPRQFPPADLQRSRQFPPSDVRNSKLPKKPQKRRILDDDEDDYDSELDDFIDDGPEEDQNYSNYIKEIFGYDKSRYREAEDDDAAMESNFAQQMKEEYLSKKIGLMEDLEDMRLEAEEKKRKALTKKRKVK